MKHALIDDHLSSLQYDIYQRYAALFHILNSLYPADGAQKVKLLDLGCGASRLTEQFLPSHYEITRADVDRFDDPSVIKLEPGAPLPFEDGSFDVVIAMDVVEHISKEHRQAFVAESSRVAGRLVVLCFPENTPAVSEAETVLRAGGKAIFGEENAFLVEHAELTLPKSADVVAVMEASGLAAACYPASPLSLWTLFSLLDFLVLSQFGLGEQKDHLNRLANHISPMVYDAPSQAYRRFCVGAKDDADLAAINDAVRLLTSSATEPLALDLSLQLCRELSVVGEQLHNSVEQAVAAKDSHIQKLEAVLQETHTSLHQAQNALNEAVALKDAHIEKLDAELNKSGGELLQLRDELAAALSAKDEHIKKLDALVQEIVCAKVDVEKNLAVAQAKITELHGVNDESAAHIHDLQAKIETTIGYKLSRLRQSISNKFKNGGNPERESPSDIEQGE